MAAAVAVAAAVEGEERVETVAAGWEESEAARGAVEVAVAVAAVAGAWAARMAVARAVAAA